jgi:hypothetical protein
MAGETSDATVFDHRIDGDGNRRSEEQSESKSYRGRRGITFYLHGGLPMPKFHRIGLIGS